MIGSCLNRWPTRFGAVSKQVQCAVALSHRPRRYFVAFDRDGRLQLSASSGSRSSTISPPSGRFDALTTPPCRRTARSAIANPSPTPPGVASARVIEPVKRPEQFVERRRWNARTGIQHANHRFVLSNTRLARHAHDHIGSFGGMPHGVAHDIFNRTAQQRRASPQHSFFLDFALHAAASVLGFELRVLATSRTSSSSEKAVRFIVSSPASGGPAFQQPPDQLVEPGRFQFDALQHRLGFRARTLPSQAQRHIQSRQRRTQLVRNIVQQLRLRSD